MTIKKLYTFRIPRNEQGGVSINTVAQGLLAAGATTNKFMGIITEMARFIACGEVLETDRDDAMLRLGVELVLRADTGIIGNPAKAAAALDEWLSFQWSEASLEDMDAAGLALQEGLAKVWEAKVETVSVPATSKATLAV